MSSLSRTSSSSDLSEATVSSTASIDSRTVTSVHLDSSSYATSRATKGEILWRAVRKKSAVTMGGTLVVALALHFIGMLYQGGAFGSYFDTVATAVAAAFVLSAITCVVSHKKLQWYKNEARNHFGDLFQNYHTAEKSDAANSAGTFKKARNWLFITGAALGVLGGLILLISSVTWIQQHIFSLHETGKCPEGFDTGITMMSFSATLLGGALYCQKKKREMKALALPQEERTGVTPSATVANKNAKPYTAQLPPFPMAYQGAEALTHPLREADQPYWDALVKLHPRLTHTELHAHLTQVIGKASRQTQTEDGSFDYDLDSLGTVGKPVLTGEVRLSVEKRSDEYTIKNGETSLMITLTKSDLGKIQSGSYDESRGITPALIYAILTGKTLDEIKLSLGGLEGA